MFHGVSIWCVHIHIKPTKEGACVCPPACRGEFSYSSILAVSMQRNEILHNSNMSTYGFLVLFQLSNDFSLNASTNNDLYRYRSVTLSSCRPSRHKRRDSPMSGRLGLICSIPRPTEEVSHGRWVYSSASNSVSSVLRWHLPSWIP